MAEIGIVQSEGLNLRMSASEFSSVIDELNHGDRLHLGKRETVRGVEWVHVFVTRTQQYGWVASRFLKVEKEPPSPLDAPLPDPEVHEELKPVFGRHDYMVWIVVIAIIILLWWVW